MGGRASAKLERAGFYPDRGGELEVVIEPSVSYTPLDLSSRGKILRRAARAIISHLPRKIAERELAIVTKELSWGQEDLAIEESISSGPEHLILLEIESEKRTEIFTGFGERGLPAEAVADRAVKQVRRYLAAGVAVGEHLTDQLLLPMAMMKGGCFSMIPPSRHTETNIDIIRKFLSINISVREIDRRSYMMEVKV